MKNMMNQQYKSIKTPVHHSHDNPVCSTCKSFIDDPTYRFLIVKDKNMKQKLLSFHYFFPCWDVHYVCENLVQDDIVKAGFSCDGSILKNPKAIDNLRKNPDLWDLQVI